MTDLCDNNVKRHTSTKRSNETVMGCGRLQNHEGDCGDWISQQGDPVRPSWDAYYLAMSEVVARRATCDRKHVGAIIVDKRHRIISTGYNGSARKMPHCDEEGHLLKEVDGRESCVRTLHAESNALDDAGRRAEGGTIYVTVIPCFNCILRIVNAGIQRVVWDEYYPSQNTGLVKEFLEKARIPYVSVHDGVTWEPESQLGELFPCL